MNQTQTVERLLLGTPIPGIQVIRTGEGYRVAISPTQDWMNEDALISALVSEGFNCICHDPLTFRCSCWKDDNDSIYLKAEKPQVKQAWSAVL